MELRQIATCLGIEKYPEELEELYTKVDLEDTTLCDPARLEEIQSEYGAFGEYFEEIKTAAREISESRELLAWLNLAFAFCRDVTAMEARKMPFPPFDESVGRNLFGALLFAAEIPMTVERYRARGFDGEMIARCIGNLGRNIWVCELTLGKTVLTQGYYGWLTHYTKAVIFDHKGLNYQPSVWEPNSLVLKNKKSGEFVIVMIQGRFHKNGLVLGSAGAKDEEGAFGADFSEQIDAFFGHPVKDGRVLSVRRCFLKSEWSAVLRPGDEVVNLHIPRNTNFDPAYVEESLREGLALSKRHFPELQLKGAICCSWMLDPAVARILGKGSKIASFSARFEKHPVNDASGTACMGYVFPGVHCATEELPEKTTLQRGVKAMALSGEFIQWTMGVMTDTL